MKIKHSLADQLLGIGSYTYSPEGQLYFIHGKTRIKVTEHFPSEGKPMSDLLGDVVLFSARQAGCRENSLAK